MTKVSRGRRSPRRHSTFDIRNSTFARAFTLAELMIVSAIVGVVVAASSTMVFQVDGARRRADRDADALAEADAAINVIAGALSNVYRPGPDDDEVVFEGVTGQTGPFIADRIRFFTVTHVGTRFDQPESDVREVEFALYDDMSRPFPVLRRRLDPTYNGEEDFGGVIDELAERVVMLRFSYFDGTVWTDEWPVDLNMMPVAVRVIVQVVRENVYESDDRAPQLITRSRLITFPRLPQAGQTGDQTQGTAVTGQQQQTGGGNFQQGGGQ